MINEDFEDAGSSTKVDFDKILQSLVTTMEHPDPFVRKVTMYWMSRIVRAHINDSQKEIKPSNGKDNDKRGKEEQDESRDNERCRSLRPEMDGYSLPTGRRGTKPPSLRVDDELPRRMDRNRMLGNAIDPMIAYQLMTAINEY